MVTKGTLSRSLAVAALLTSSAALAPAALALDTFTIRGVFNGTTTDPTTGAGTPVITDTITGAGAPTLTDNEKFTLTGVFDPSNVAFNLYPGFYAYSPLSVTLTIYPTGMSSQSFTVQTYSQSHTTGFTVAIFDSTYAAGSGHFAAGFLQDPPNDGAGIIGDWLTGDPPPSWTVSNLTNYEWTTSSYFGVGFASGRCPNSFDPATGACIPSADENTIVPIPLDGGLYDLTLGVYDLNNPNNFIPDNPNDNLFSASLTTPETSTWAMMFLGFAGLAVAGLLKSRKAGLTA